MYLLNQGVTICEFYKNELINLLHYLFYYVDTVVAVEYIFHGYRRWFYFNIGLLLIPTSIIQVLSLKWYYDDGKLKNIHWISHISLLGILYRYLLISKYFMLNSMIKFYYHCTVFINLYFLNNHMKILIFFLDT